VDTICGTVLTIRFLGIIWWATVSACPNILSWAMSSQPMSA